MEIFVIHDGKQLGPFTAEDAQAQIDSGNFSTTDYAWTAGLDDWKPLSDVLLDQNHPVTEPAIPVTETKSKKPLRWKLIISLAASLVLVGLIITFGLLGRGSGSRTAAHLSRFAPSPYSARFLESQKPGVWDLASLARKARPAVVLIQVYNAQHEEIATGTGFFISSDGFLITNRHVIENAASAVAKGYSGGLFQIKGVAALDDENDIALLSVAGASLPHLTLADSETTEVGSHVAVIGSPLGLEGTLSEGIVSAKRISTDTGRKWLQLTAAVSPGSSGSPVFNAESEVIGVATMILTGGEALNFAVPSNAITSLLEKAKDRRELMPFPQPVGNGELAKLIYYQSAMKSAEYESADKALTNARQEAGLTELHAASGANLSAKWDAALQAAQALVAKYPEFALGYDKLGDVYSNIGLIDEAITAYQRAVKLEPIDTGSAARSWNSLGNLYRKRHEDAQADYAFSKAIFFQTESVNSQPRGVVRSFSLYSLGNMLKDAGRIDDAERTYLATTNEYPQNPLAWSSLAEIYVGRMELEKAAMAYHDGMADKRYSEAWKMVAYKLHDNGKEEWALKCWQLSEQLKARGQ